MFGLTTGLAVAKINTDLGYEPVTYSELTQDDAFWEGCKSCVNYDIPRSARAAKIVFVPPCYMIRKTTTNRNKPRSFFPGQRQGLRTITRFKQWKLLRPFMRKDKNGNNGTGSSNRSFKFSIYKHCYGHGKKVVLGFSGGLVVPSSISQRGKGYEVHSIIVNTGGFSKTNSAILRRMPTNWA